MVDTAGDVIGLPEYRCNVESILVILWVVEEREVTLSAVVASGSVASGSNVVK